MSEKKIIQLTRDDFQKAAQQANLIKQWGAEMSMANEAPVCLVSVNTEGKKFVRMIQGVDFQKVSAILEHISQQLKFTRVVKQP